ncbi:hypothetical protein H9P43_005101 [Blastocladiella emersonii ATCC 22665]|nr:hypothetical protein H9P43_005101 [Blastocladiella emersonii ATCC 22665]
MDKPLDIGLTPVLLASADTGSPARGVFPILAPGATKDAPAPIYRVCAASALDTGSNSRFVEAPCELDGIGDPLAACAADKCAKEQAAALQMATGLQATGFFREEYLRATTVLEECKHRECPHEAWASKSGLCVSLESDYFISRKLYLPSLPPIPRLSFYDGTKLGLNSYREIHTEYLKRHDFPTKLATPPEPRNGTDKGDKPTTARLGICVPTLPLGFPCAKGAADADGVIRATNGVSGIQVTRTALVHASVSLPESLTDAQAAQFFGQVMLDPAVAPATPWLLKIPVQGMAARTYLRSSDAFLVPANVYSAGYCADDDAKFRAAGIEGASCASSAECAFAKCVAGKCAAASVGKGASTTLYVGDSAMIHYARGEFYAFRDWTIGSVVVTVVVLLLSVYAVNRFKVNRRVNVWFGTKLPTGAGKSEAMEMNAVAAGSSGN